MSKKQNWHLGVAIFVTAVGTCCCFSTAQVPSTINIQINPTNSASFLLSLENISSTDTYTYVASTSLVNGVFQDDLGVRLGVTAQVDLVVMETNNPVRFFAARSSSEEDFDGDALSNQDEFTLATDPESPDTDSDGMPDGWEVEFGLNPTVDDATNNLDADSFSNLTEYQNSTDPRIPTTLGSFLEEVEMLKDLTFTNGSDRYVTPGACDLTNVNAMASLLLAGDILGAQNIATSALPYLLYDFKDTNYNVVVYGLKEARITVTNGWGSYFINPTYQTETLVEVPHPRFDFNSWSIGARAFLEAEAVGFLVSGAHRHSNGQGTADPSDLTNTVFIEVHKA